MLCNHCHNREADNRFYVNFMGQLGEVNLCSDCVNKIMRFAGGIYQGFQQSAAEYTGDFVATSFSSHQPAVMRALGEDHFPADAGEDVKRRRRIAELKEKMESAIRREDYEAAAQLRDRIGSEEKGVTIYDT